MDNSFRIVHEFQLPPDFRDIVKAVIQSVWREVMAENLQSLKKERVKLTRREAAKTLRISLPTLDKLRADGTLQAQTLGKRVLFDQQQIENYLNRSRGQ